MTLFIVDASLATKWFLPGETGRDQAIVVLEEIRNNPSGYAVPDLFYCEMLHVLCKVFSGVGEIVDYLGSLRDLGMSLLPTGKETLSQAAKIVKKHGLSGYDAIYAANAKLVGGTWLTADKKAHQKISSLNISKCLDF